MSNPGDTLSSLQDAEDEGTEITKLEDVKELYDRAKEYWKPVFDQYDNDMAFYAGDQWDGAIQQVRTQKKLSVLVYNQLPSKVKYIVNNVRNALPGIKVRPGRDGQENTANVLNGMIIQIERESDADDAKINAYKQSVTGGLGAWQINAIDSDGDGDIDIEYERIIDPTTVLPDPASKKASHEDAYYFFRRELISRREFRSLFGKDADITNYDSEYEVDKDEVEIISYWFKRESGTVSKYVFNGSDEYLEKYEKYKGKYIPIVFLHGEELRLKGKVEYRGIVHDVRDMQMMLNLAKSRTADEMALAANGQWLVSADTIGAYPSIWQDNNINSINLLPYVPGPNGEAPKHIDPFVSSSGYMQIAQENNQDISAAIGIKDVAKDLPVGASGKAIQLQMSQSDVGTYEYADNLNKAVKYCGKIVLDLIQSYIIFPATRTIGLADGRTQTVRVNEPFVENGQSTMHDLVHGDYAVDIDVGPSYRSQRQQALDQMLDYLKLNPQQMSVVSDLVFRLMDVPEAEEFAARLRATIPANILAASDATNLNSGDPQQRLQVMIQQIAGLQQQMAGIDQQNQALIQQNQQLNLEKQSRLNEIEAQGQVKLTEIRQRLELDKAIEEAKMQHEIEMETARHQHEERMAAIKMSGASRLQAQKADETVGIDHARIAATEKADVNKIHEKAHADIFEKSMEMAQATQQYEETGTDLNH